MSRCKPRLHLLGLPHTITSEAYSHCAFTGKVLRFPDMIRPLGYHVTHYGVEGAETSADVQVDILTRAEQNQLRGHDGSDPTKFHGDDGNTGSALYREFNRRLRVELETRVDAAADLVLLPFGHGHADAVAGLPYQLIESGIGYPTLYQGARFKIFESYAWLHFHQGRANRNGNAYEWVCPNYFDAEAWEVELNPPRDTVVFLGRICAAKGLDVVWELARARPDLRFVICGQGDPQAWLGPPNLEYRPPLVGRERSAYLGQARALIMPTQFTEPFGGVAVEAQLCGTPVLCPDYGAFTETVEQCRTGFRARTLGDYLAGLDRAPELDRAYIAQRARRLYALEAVAPLYDAAFQQIVDLWGQGWTSRRSPLWSSKP